MVQFKIGFLIFITTAISIGCGASQTASVRENALQNTGSLEASPKVVSTPEATLFKGKNIVFIESDQSIFKELSGNKKKKSCLNKIDEGFSKEKQTQDTNYFEFGPTEKSEFGSNILVLNIMKDQFSQISPDSLKKLDQYVGFTDDRQIYFIKSKNLSYLLLVGHESATSGMGHYYRTHLLIPFDLNRPVIEFESISDDPRRIGIADSGSIYYTQIDPPYYGAIKESASKSLHLTGSLFTVDAAGNKRLESKVEFDCGNVEEIFDKQPTE